MRVAVANIAKFLVPDRAAADAAQAFRDGEVVMANELSSPSHRLIFRAEANKHRSQVFHRNSKVQVAVPEEWHAYGARFQLSRLVPFINPSRWLNVVYCPDENTIYAVTHMTNGAWNRQKLLTRKLRRKLWLRQERKIREHVGRWHALGWNVVVAGDMNRFSAPGLHQMQATVSEEYMHIVCIPAQGHVAQIRGELVRFKVHSDHPQVSANVRFVKRV